MATLNLGNLSDDRYIDIVFDDNGGVTLMTNEYSHYYDDVLQVANEVCLLLQGMEDDDGSGKTPDNAIQRNVKAARDSGYIWYSREDIKRVFDSGATGEAIKGGPNARKFFACLHELLDPQESA
jgi:hypothetical protein